ncbi:hypothetical protein Hanom_Chr07g00610361 [Helianthus anomalus]
MRMMMSKRLKMVMLMSMMFDDDVISPVGFTAAVFTRQTSWARWPDSHSGSRVNIRDRSTLVNGAGLSLVLGQRQSTGSDSVQAQFGFRFGSVGSSFDSNTVRVNTVNRVNSVNSVNRSQPG